MSGYSKKEQKKSIFTTKRNSEGNIVVSRASGHNGGEIRGSILRTNEGKPYLVSGKGIEILSGSNTGYPGPGQIQLQVNVGDIRTELYTLVSSFGIAGTPGPAGQTGARGADGVPGNDGDNGDNGAPGPAGPGITLIETEPGGELTITYGSTGATHTTDPLKGDKGDKGDDGDAGPAGEGWTSGAYDGATGKISFSSDTPALEFETLDLRGAGQVPGDKTTSRLTLYSGPPANFNATSGTPPDWPWIYFNYDRWVDNSTLSVEFKWNITASISCTAPSGTTTTPAEFNVRLLYYDVTIASWETVTDFFVTNEEFSHNDSETKIMELDISAALSTELAGVADSALKLELITEPGEDDAGADHDLAVFFGGSGLDIVYTV